MRYGARCRTACDNGIRQADGRPSALFCLRKITQNLTGTWNSTHVAKRLDIDKHWVSRMERRLRHRRAAPTYRSSQTLLEVLNKIMTPKFYSFLWALFTVAVGVVWLGGAMTMFALTAFGFVAFGLVFVGMMCVLPGVVGHSHEPVEKAPVVKRVKRAKSETLLSPKDIRVRSAFQFRPH